MPVQGSLNAGAALRLVEKPVRTLYHFGTNSSTPYTLSKSVYANFDTVYLTEKYTTPFSAVYNPGKYIVKTYEINATISHPGLYPTDSIMHHWPRHSSSNVFDLPNAQKRMDMHQRTKFVSFGTTSSTLKGYIYEVKDSTGTFLDWWPCDTSFALIYQMNQSIMEFSVLSKNKAVGISESGKTTSNVQLIPNPANKNQIVHLECVNSGECKVDLYDLQGRIIRNVYEGHVDPGPYRINHYIGDLDNSLYIYVITVDGQTISRKFIKE